MKTRLRIFMMVFFLFSQTVSGSSIYNTDKGDDMKSFMTPVFITVCFQVAMRAIPARFDHWKAPLQVGFIVFISKVFWAE